MRAIVRHLPLLFWLGAASPVWATHVEACKNLPTTGTKTESIRVPGAVENPFCNASCNPLNPALPAVSGSKFQNPPDAVLKYTDASQSQCEQKRGAADQPTGACKLDTICRAGATRVKDAGGVVRCKNPDTLEPRSVASNPQEECLRTAPAVPWPIAITNISGGAAGPARTWTRSDDTLLVFGNNVGVPGNTVTADGGCFAVWISSRPDCPGPNCLAVGVSTSAVAGPKSFVIRAAHGHAEVRGNLEVVASQPSAAESASVQDGRLVRVRPAAAAIRTGQTLGGNTIVLQAPVPLNQPATVTLSALTFPAGGRAQVVPDRFTLPANTPTATFPFSVVVSAAPPVAGGTAPSPAYLGIGATVAIPGGTDCAIAYLTIASP